MNPTEFKHRTKTYGLRIIRLYEALPKRGAAPVLGKQLLRAGTSVGANYRAACRARSTPDFVSKMGIVEEECDESLYWTELLVEAGYVRSARLAKLVAEGQEILAMIVASIHTARRGKKSAIRNPQSAIQ